MADAKHNILITAPGGNIGTELIPKILTNPNYHLILPTSNAARLQSKLPSTTNISTEEGSIQDPNWIESLLRIHNIDVVFLCLTGTDELLTSLNFFNAMERAGTVKYLLYLSACGDMASPEGVEFIMKANSSEHVLVKTTLEQKLRYSGYPWQTTVLGPALFFSNDLRSKKHMLEEGIFDEPVGEKGVSRVATEDIALAAHNLIATFPKYAGRKIQIGSLKKFTGAEIVKLWSDATGKEVKMVSRSRAKGCLKQSGRGSSTLLNRLILILIAPQSLSAQLRTEKWGLHYGHESIFYAAGKSMEISRSMMGNNGRTD